MKPLKLKCLLVNDGYDGYVVAADDLTDVGSHPDGQPYRVMGGVLDSSGNLDTSFTPVIHFFDSFLEAQTVFSKMVMMAAAAFDEQAML